MIASSKRESSVIQTIVEKTDLKQNQIQFVPKSDGFHGSRSLWEGQKGAEEYWSAVKQFLSAVYPKNQMTIAPNK